MKKHNIIYGIMKQFFICLFLIGAINSLQAQDKIVLRNGRTIDVRIQRNYEDRVEYTYPGEASVYERPKTAISYILFENGRKEICDKNQNTSTASRSTSNEATNRTVPASSTTTSTKKETSKDQNIYWQDVKTTFAETDVIGMSRLQRISAVSSAGYKDAIQQLKKKAAALGGTIILVMDVPDSDSDEVEVMGIAFRDKNVEYTPRSSTNERSTSTNERSSSATPTPAEMSNIRRRRIAKQMESYNNETNIETGTRPASQRSASERNEAENEIDAPDAIYLLNGRVIRGTIEEFEPDDFVSIRTPAGKIAEYSMDDVKRVSRGSARGAKTTTAAKSSSRSNRTYDDDRSQRENLFDFDDGVKSGYQGIFDIGYKLAMGNTGEQGNLEINTSHGYRINEFLFLGVGVGLHVYSARSPNLKIFDQKGASITNNTYPQYVETLQSDSKIEEKYRPYAAHTYLHAVDSSYMTVPLFFDARGYYPMGSTITPFVMCRIGFAFNLSDGFGGMGYYVNPAIGATYQLTPKIALNFSVGYSYQNYGGIPADGGYGFWYYKDKAGKEPGVDANGNKIEKTWYEAKGAGGILFKLGVEF